MLSKRVVPHEKLTRARPAPIRYEGALTLGRAVYPSFFLSVRRLMPRSRAASDWFSPVLDMT